MNLGDTLSLSLRNLRQSKLRTTLTMLGVAIGIASLTGMVSLGVGLQDQVIGQLMRSGVFANITVTSGFPFGGRGGLRGRGGRGRGNPEAAGSTSPRLDDAALKKIAEVEGVLEAYPELRVPVEITLGDFSQPSSATGVPFSSRDEGVFQTLSFGTFFKGESDETCMLSLNMAKQIQENDPGGLVGKSLTLSYAASRGSVQTPNLPLSFQIQRMDRSCPIVGIVEREGGGLPIGGGAAGLMIPLSMAKAINAESVTNAQSFVRDPEQAKSYNSITVKVKQAQLTQDVEDRIRKLGYSAFSVNDALRGAKGAFIILDIVLSLIGSIALTVSALGIVNTMVMSILERTREIGIMKAIGAGNTDIRRIFLIEASAIGLLGGIFGVAIGWMVGKVITFAANLYIQSQGGTPTTIFSFPLWLVGSALAFSIVVSLVAGSYPASRAARLDPIRALRHD